MSAGTVCERLERCCPIHCVARVSTNTESILFEPTLRAVVLAGRRSVRGRCASGSSCAPGKRRLCATSVWNSTAADRFPAVSFAQIVRPVSFAQIVRPVRFAQIVRPVRFARIGRRRLLLIVSR